MHTQFDDDSLGVKMDEHLNPLPSLVVMWKWDQYKMSNSLKRVDSFMTYGAHIATNSIFVPSVVVLSLMYQFL